MSTDQKKTRRGIWTKAKDADPACHRQAARCCRGACDRQRQGPRRCGNRRPGTPVL